MSFTFIDIILIGIVIVFVVSGFVMGLIQGIGALIGLAAGFWAAMRYFSAFGDWLTPIFMGHGIWAHIIAFILIFVLANRLVGLIFWLIERVFKIISIIPFLKSINRLGGAVLGLVEGILVCGLILGFLFGYFGELGWIKDNLSGSTVAHWLAFTAGYIKDAATVVIHAITGKL